MNISLRSAAQPAHRPPVPVGPTRFGRLGGWCWDHRRRVLALWIGLVVVIVGLALAAGSNYRNDYGGTGGSQKALNLLTQRFPAQAGDTIQVVFRTTAPVTAPAEVRRIDRLDAAVAPLAHVSSVASPFASGQRGVSRDGHIAFSTIQLDRTADHLSSAAIKRIMHVAQSFRSPGFAVNLGGTPISSVVGAAPGSSEGVGIGAAILIMLIAFGSVVAMGLPLVTALLGLAAGYGLLTLFSHLAIDPSFAPEMMAMIGLGVGIDYALLIITRYRQGLAEGRTPREATVVAHMTAGRSVLFAGGTVVVSLLGLLLTAQAYMVGLAVGTIIGVLLVLAAALTLLPALAGFAGDRIDRFHLRLPGTGRGGRRPQDGPSEQLPGRRVPGGSAAGFWNRWSRQVQRRPVACGVAALCVIGALAVPLFSMRMAFSDASNDPSSLTTRQAYDTLARGFGPGFNGPLVLAAEMPSSAGATGAPAHTGGQGTLPPAGRAAVARLERRLATTKGVALSLPPVVDPSGDLASVVVYPTTGPQSAATASLVHHLRDQTIPAAVGSSGVRVYVGGETAAGIDVANFMAARLPWVMALVILVAFFFLMCLFRSVAVALKAAVMNLLSVGAAFGVMVAVFQWGWLASWFGMTAGPIDPWIPVMIFTIVFGLSMDYEVFLLSRIREEWLRSGDNSASVTRGLATTARVITAAAAIMVCVFASFLVNDPLRILNVFALGLAVAIAIDATLVRMVLVPAVMQLLGDANWWLPTVLGRHLPQLGAEPDLGTGSGARSA